MFKRSAFRSVTVALPSLWALASCADSSPSAPDLHEAALTVDQCEFFYDPGAKTTICHRTSSPVKPFVIIKTDYNGCLNGHANHPLDFLTSNDPSDPMYDPSCSGAGCYPIDAPYDKSADCCAGLQPSGAEGDQVCTNVDGCAKSPCDANAVCTDNAWTDADPWGRVCACKDGYEGSGEPGDCKKPEPITCDFASISVPEAQLLPSCFCDDAARKRMLDETKMYLNVITQQIRELQERHDDCMRANGGEPYANVADFDSLRTRLSSAEAAFKKQASKIPALPLCAAGSEECGGGEEE